MALQTSCTTSSSHRRHSLSYLSLSQECPHHCHLALLPLMMLSLMQAVLRPEALSAAVALAVLLTEHQCLTAQCGPQGQHLWLFWAVRVRCCAMQCLHDSEAVAGVLMKQRSWEQPDAALAAVDPAPMYSGHKPAAAAPIAAQGCSQQMVAGWAFAASQQLLKLHVGGIA